MQATHLIPQTMERPNMAEKWYEATQRFKSEVMSDRAKTRIKKEFAHAADLSASKVKHLLDGATRPTTDEVNTFAGLVEKEWLTAKDFAEFGKPTSSPASPRRRKPSLRTSKQPLHD